MEERRKHPTECLMQEEWGMIKQYMKSTKEETDDFRLNLKLTLEQIRKDDKDRFEILISQIRADKVDRDNELDIVNKRVSGIKSTAGKIIFWGVVSLISFATAYGGLTTLVVINTEKWKVLEPEHKVILQDIEVLKEGHNELHKPTSVGMRSV